jgi:hypothetical protein
MKARHFVCRRFRPFGRKLDFFNTHAIFHQLTCSYVQELWAKRVLSRVRDETLDHCPLFTRIAGLATTVFS